MKYYHGIPVNPGVAIAPVSIVTNDRVRIRPRGIDKTLVSSELARLDHAFDCASASLERSQLEATEQLGEQYGQIFGAHALILKDAKLRARIESTISEDLLCAEYAVDQAFSHYARLLSKLDVATYADRANDILDVRDCVLGHLVEVTRETTFVAGQPTVLAANFLSPSEAASLDPTRTLAIATETGGLGSHTAIVASALGIPTVLGLGPFLSELDGDGLVIVDGDVGALIVDPDESTLESYTEKLERQQARRVRLETLCNEVQIKTLDGTTIEIKGNIEFPNEARLCDRNGANGVGLYRTEFLYLTAPPGTLPDEETHFRAYKEVLETMGPDRTTTIRTFDLGADKTFGDERFASIKEENPFMGFRSIRLSLRHTDIFRTQLRAILRASVYGKAQILFPLLTTLKEYRDAKALFGEVCEDLLEEGIPFDRNIPLGVMVETPAATVMLEQFAAVADFFSLGTNDLLQYTMAVDRSNERVSELYAQESPAVLKLIEHTIGVSSYYKKPLSICGQMASMPHMIPLLLGMGLRTFSVAPSMILQMKELCLSLTIERCEQIKNIALAMDNAIAIRAHLRNEIRKILGPDAS